MSDTKIRPETPIRYLKSVGPEKSQILARLDIFTVQDLFYFFPRRYEDRRQVKPIDSLTGQEKECARGFIQSRGLIRTRAGQSILKVVLAEKGLASLPRPSTLFGIWFNQPYLAKIFLPKTEVIFYGLAQRQGRQLQMVHPEYEILLSDQRTETVHTGRVVPIYPLTEDLYQKTIRQLVHRVTILAGELVTDPLSAEIKNRLSMVDLPHALRQIHFPEDLQHYRQAYRRLVFDEFYLLQLLIQSKKRLLQKENQRIAHRTSGIGQVERLIQSLEFELTAGQRGAIRDILQQMQQTRPMNRLVQGDVGSGKTIVAAAALVFTCSSGFQGAFMAPTEVLAQQHFISLTQILEPLGMRCGYLGGGLSASERDEILRHTETGKINVLVGTHALIQSGVRFHNLGLAVIDEQHKFGVFQRAALKDKSDKPVHCLLMTATPIPRTLAMTFYGDLDISTIRELPKGRKAVETLWVGQEHRQGIYEFVDQLIEKGSQVYIVCPWIDAKNDPDIKSLKQAYSEIGRFFASRRVGILHGKMAAQIKKKMMESFKNKSLDILISTVVIEVGVDVPNASVMLIENAEKFGLSQLHQLRGRIGRSQDQAYCFLFSNSENEQTVQRLEVFTQTRDGFEIAQKDLELRGAGELAGERQHGLAKLRIGDLAKDVSLLELARAEACRTIEADPKLEQPDRLLLKKELEQRFGPLDEAMAAVNT